MHSSKIKKIINNKPIKSEISFRDPDVEHVLRAKKGDMESFRILINQYQEKVRNLVYSILFDKDIVDDIAQEVFIKVHSKLDSFNFQSKFSTWLYQITLNKCRDEIRKRKLKALFFISADSSQAYQENLEIKTEQRDISIIIHQKISELPNKLKEVLLLKDLEELSYKEISQVIGCNEGTVKSRLFRARETLRRKLIPFKDELGF